MMTEADFDPLEGGCDCGAIRYRMETAPLVVHRCHCRWCQRETGASFALNAMIEADRVTTLAGEPMIVDTPSQSGAGQRVTLDQPERLQPDIHIFTASKQPWVVIPPEAPAVPEFYEREAHWPPESLARRQAMLAKARLS